MPLSAFGRASLILPLILLMQLVAPLSAATIMQTGDSEGRCQLVMDGEIEDGDADKIREALGEIVNPWDAAHKHSNFTLCLNSPGGGWLEAIAMLDIIREAGVQTYVGEGHRCLSACAMVFLGGARYTAEEQILHYVDRTLHPQAILGFHAPYVVLEDRIYSSQHMSSAFNYAMLSASKIVSRAESLEIPLDFIAEMLATPPEGFIFIDTVEKARNLLIDLDNIVISPNFSSRDVVNICNKAWPVQLGQRLLETDLRLYDNESGRIDRGSFIVNREIMDGLLENFICLVEIDAYNANEVRVRVNPYGSNNGQTSAQYELFEIDFFQSTVKLIEDDAFVAFEQVYPQQWGDIYPRYYQYSDDTLLQDLPLTEDDLAAYIQQRGIESAGIIDSQAYEQVPTLTPVLSENCGLRGEYVYVSNFYGYANVYSEAGSDHEVVGRGTSGDRFDIVENDKFRLVGSLAARVECAAVCVRMNVGNVARTPEDHASLLQCGDDNVMWFQIRNSDGVTGYVNGKFLAYSE